MTILTAEQLRLTLALTFMDQGHNAVRLPYPAKYGSQSIDIDRFINIFNHMEQNVTLSFKIKHQSHTCNANVKVQTDINKMF